MIFNTSTLVSLFVSSFLFLDGATADTCCVALGSTACPAGYQTAAMAVTMTTGTICGKGVRFINNIIFIMIDENDDAICIVSACRISFHNQTQKSLAFVFSFLTYNSNSLRD